MAKGNIQITATSMIAMLALAATLQSAVAGTTRGFVDAGVDGDRVPTGKGWGEQRSAAGGANGTGQAKPSAGSTSSNGISYHGGPLITSPLTVYYIWYGNWSNNTAPQILSNLASYIGGSPYFNINTTYYNGTGQRVQNTVATSVSPASPALFGTQPLVTNYSSSLSDSDVQKVVSDHITNNLLPADPNGVYFVLTSADVNETSGFCTKYCGWHTHASIAGKDIKYAFVGNPDRCPSACEAQTTSPNGNSGADGMASVIAHELEEAASDPDLNAWYDNRGMENADKCAWTFGTTYTVANGSHANMKIGSLNYLIQRNWVNAAGGYCNLSYP